MYLILAIANAVLVAYAIREGLRDRPFALLFWAASAFFTGYPLLVDSFFCATGNVDIILWLYKDSADGIAPLLDSVILNRACSFVLAFNCLFYLTLQLIGGRQPGWRTTTLSLQDQDTGLFVAIVLAIGGNLALLYIVGYEFGGLTESLQQRASYFGFGSDGYEAKSRYLRSFANSFVYASPFATYFGIRRRIPLLTLAGVIPALALAYITSQRPWLFCVAGVLALNTLGPGYADAKQRLTGVRNYLATPARLLGIALLAITTLFTSYFVRYERSDTYSGRTAEAAGESVGSVVLMRDVSIFVFYWTIDAVPERLPAIGGFSTLQIPATLLHLPINFAPTEQVGYYLALNRNHLTDSTLHPTVYGYAYCDLAWAGLVWALIMALIIGSAERYIAGREQRLFALAPMMSMLIAVVVRGSPHYGITRAWYSAIAIGAIFFVATLARRGDHSSVVYE